MTIRTVLRSDSSRSANSLLSASNASVACVPTSAMAEGKACLSRAARSRRTAYRWRARAEADSAMPNPRQAPFHLHSYYREDSDIHGFFDIFGGDE